MKTISVKEDFSELPGLRNCSISEKSGEEFYHTILNNEFKEAYDKKEKLAVDLDRTEGYASSFLDEAFGNLVYDFTLDIVKNNLEIISMQEPEWKEMIQDKTFLQWEDRRKNTKPPMVTKLHGPWYRLVGNVLEHKVWEKPSVAE